MLAAFVYRYCKASNQFCPCSADVNFASREFRGSSMTCVKRAVQCTMLCCCENSLCHGVTKHLAETSVLLGMYRLLSAWTVPEHVRIYLQGRHENPIHPSVEVFVVGVILGQLVGCSLWPAGMKEKSYWLMLAGGRFQMPVNAHVSAWVLLPHAHSIALLHLPHICKLQCTWACIPEKRLLPY